MNNKLSITYLILMSAPLFLGCEPATGENKINASASLVALQAGNNKSVVVDTKESVIDWKGSGVGGAHTGFVYVSKGELKIENGQLAGGTVEVDMQTIEDEKHRKDNGLIDHLKDPDFFDVKKFPVSTISITKVEPIKGADIKITANLRIKGITQPVAFPAKTEVKGGMVIAYGKLVIDRTKWDIRYKSGKFYDNLANEAISDEIEFNIKIVAKNKVN